MVFVDPLPSRDRARVFRIKPGLWRVTAPTIAPNVTRGANFSTQRAAFEYAYNLMKSLRMLPVEHPKTWPNTPIPRPHPWISPSNRTSPAYPYWLPKTFYSFSGVYHAGPSGPVPHPTTAAKAARRGPAPPGWPRPGSL